MRFPTFLVIVYGLIEATVAQISLDTAAPFALIASQAITNAGYGNTIIEGYLGLYPNTESSITGFDSAPPGTIHAGDDVARLALQDAQSAYNAAKSRTPTAQIMAADLGGQILIPGTYRSASAVEITGPLILDARNDPGALFVFQIGSTLTTASASSVILVNEAQACNVFFQVGSSATLGSTTTFNGNIIAQISISLTDGVSVNGGLYALEGAITLNNNRVTAQQACPVAPTSSTTSAVFVTSATDTFTSLVPVVDLTSTVSEPGDVATTSLSDFASTTSLVDIRTSASSTSTVYIRTSTKTTSTEEIRTITSKTPTKDIPTSTTVPLSTTTALSNGDVITTSSDETMTTSTGDQPAITLSSDIFTTVVSSSVISMTRRRSGTSTFISSTVTTTKSIPPETTSLSGSTFSYNSRVSKYPDSPYSSISRPIKTQTRPTIQTFLVATANSNASISGQVSRSSANMYSVYVSTSVMGPSGWNQTRWKTSTQPSNTSSQIVASTQANAGTTTIHGTPCTTLSYYEPTCSCTQTTVVPIAYTPVSQATTMRVITVNGIPCTTVRYYEETCDCVRTSNVPIQVVSASISIATYINDVPCITSKYYEPACNCVQTATVPVRIASENATAAAITEVAYAPTASDL